MNYTIPFHNYELRKNESGIYHLFITGMWDPATQQFIPCEPYLMHPDPPCKVEGQIKCSTVFELLWSGDHEPLAEGQCDSLGNYWCNRCQLQAELMHYGAEKGYRALYDKKQLIIKPGQQKWLLYARTMGYSRVEEALALMRPKEEKKKPAAKPRQLTWI